MCTVTADNLNAIQCNSHKAILKVVQYDSHHVILKAIQCDSHHAMLKVNLFTVSTYIFKAIEFVATCKNQAIAFLPLSTHTFYWLNI